MPEGKEFLKYLDLWTQAPTGEECPLAGKAGYSNALVWSDLEVMVKASHFRTSHTKMASQNDFIEAYSSARRIAKEMSATSGATIFPYSKFYIFFDQYATIYRLTITLIVSALVAIWVVGSLLLGSIWTGFCITLVVGMIVVDIMGIMALWGISLNAVSLVNLVICVGISVEFCSHIARAFMFPPSSPSLSSLSKGSKSSKLKYSAKDARAWAALTGTGGSVFCGITLTKVIGVGVLAWTRSKIFEIYYFRMWAALVGVGGLHALVWLPVVLSVLGGGEEKGWASGSGEADGEGLEGDLRRRSRYISESGRYHTVRQGEEEGEEEDWSDDDEGEGVERGSLLGRRR